jgi:hypothetical protein
MHEWKCLLTRNRWRFRWRGNGFIRRSGNLGAYRDQQLKWARHHRYGAKMMEWPRKPN